MRDVEVKGVKVSAIGLGTWQFGSKDWGYGTEYAQVEAARILDRALELGITLIDTAEIYGRNESERIVGRALAGRREQAFIATKVLPLFPTASYVEKHGRAQRAAARRRHDRPVPDSLAEPDHADRPADGGHAAAATGGPCA